MARIFPAGLAGETGSVSVVAAAIVFPVVLTMLGACFQAGLWFAAREVALGAAQQGVSDARVTGGTAGRGAAAACGFAATAGHGLLLRPSCSGSGAAATVTVTVCGSAPALIPGVPTAACEQASGARERFTSSGARPLRRAAARIP